MTTQTLYPRRDHPAASLPAYRGGMRQNQKLTARQKLAALALVAAAVVIGPVIGAILVLSMGIPV